MSLVVLMTSMFCLRFYYLCNVCLFVVFIYLCSVVGYVSARGVERVWPLRVKWSRTAASSLKFIRVTLFSIESHRRQIALLF